MAVLVDAAGDPCHTDGHSLPAVVLYILALLDMNETVERANKLEIKHLKEKNQEASL